jgi:hypothetical protein
MKRIYTFQEFVFEAYNALIEGKDTDTIKDLVSKIRESDSEEIKSQEGYEEVMKWFENEGPEKGQALIDTESMVKSLKYWLGDLSEETSASFERDQISIGKLKDKANVERVLKACDKATESSDFTKFDLDLITKSAEAIEKKIGDLRKNGVQIGAKEPSTGASYKTRTSATGDPQYLGIIPFSGTEDKKPSQKYEGKGIKSINAKVFKIWYESLKKDGVVSKTDSLDNKKYWLAKATVMEVKDKIKILEGIQEKAEKENKNISDALKIEWKNKNVKQEYEEGETITPLEPLEKTSTLSFPESGEKAMTFFPEDKASLSDIPEDFKTSLKSSIKELKDSLEKEGAEITSVKIQAISSTSKVPSGYTSKTGKKGNEGLVEDRIQAVKDLTLASLKENGMDVNVSYDETGKKPNQGPEWGDSQRSDPKYGKKGARTEAYEEEYGKWRYSGVFISITYKVEISREIKDEFQEYTRSGDWDFNITWTKPKPPDIKKPRGVRIRSGGLSPVKGSTDCYLFDK